MWTASRYAPDADIRAAWGKLFRLIAWGAALPSFALLFYSVTARHATKDITDMKRLGYFLTEYVAAIGVGLAALAASVALSRIRRRDMPILFGSCCAGVIALYLPSLLGAWPVLVQKGLPGAAFASFVFPFVLVLLATFAWILGKRRPAAPKPPPSETP